MQTERQDIYTRITTAIVAELEKGVRPWLKPWNAEHAAGRITRPLRIGGQPYQGVNVLMLWLAAETQGFSAPIWLTFNQAKELGAHVKPGAKGSPVVYANRIRKAEAGDDGEAGEHDIFFLKSYTVFNAEQVAGLPDHYYAPAAPPLDPVARIAAADRFFAGTGADIRHGGNRAYYAEGPDYVQMPPFPRSRMPNRMRRRSPTS